MSAVITGMGIISPIGLGVDVFWSALLEGACGIREITRFDTDGYVFTRAGEVTGFSPPAAAKHTDPATQFMLAATDEAVRGAKLTPDTVDPLESGIALGTNFGGISSAEQLLGDGPTGGYGQDNFAEYGFQQCADHVAQAFELRGPRCVLSLSCSSGAAALGLGLEWIRAGRAKVVVTGGYDALSRFAWSGLSALRTMSRHAVRPFDRRRDGTIFSEGAAALVVEDVVHARRRGAPIVAEVCGYGLNNNAYHLTAPSKDSAGTSAVMRMALADSGMDASQVDHINAHGTATRHNDAAESAAIREVFGDAGSSPSVTANKSSFGHMMGAAGCAEAVASILTLRHSIIPATLNCEEPDPDCPVDLVRDTPREVDVQTVLSNSAGIGGTNAALVLRKAGP